MDNKLSKLEIKYNYFDRFYKQKILKSIENDGMILWEELNFNNEEEFKKEIENLKNRMILKNNNLCDIIDFSTIMIKDSLKDIYKLRIFYEFSKLNLKEKIRIIKEKKINFSLEEIFYLIFDLINVLSYLQNNFKIHGDLRPEYIICWENNINKLINRINNKLQFPNNLIKNFQSKNEDFYFSPEIYNLLSKNLSIKDFDFYKLEIFSLGLIILEIGLLESVQNLYKNQFDLNLLNKLKIKFKNKYDNELLSIIIDLWLEINYEKRHDYSKIKYILPSYKDIKLLFNLEKYNKIKNFNNKQKYKNIIKENKNYVENKPINNLNKTPMNFNTYYKKNSMNSTNSNKLIYNTKSIKGRTESSKIITNDFNSNDFNSNDFNNNDFNSKKNSSIFLSKNSINNNNNGKKKEIFESILEKKLFIKKNN